jgi:hypothetical protein
MRRLVQLIADYEPGELAFAERLQRLERRMSEMVRELLPSTMSTTVPTSVKPAATSSSAATTR